MVVRGGVGWGGRLKDIIDLVCGEILGCEGVLELIPMDDQVRGRNIPQKSCLQPPKVPVTFSTRK